MCENESTVSKIGWAAAREEAQGKRQVQFCPKPVMGPNIYFTTHHTAAQTHPRYCRHLNIHTQAETHTHTHTHTHTQTHTMLAYTHLTTSENTLLTQTQTHLQTEKNTMQDRTHTHILLTDTDTHKKTNRAECASTEGHRQENRPTSTAWHSSAQSLSAP